MDNISMSPECADLNVYVVEISRDQKEQQLVLMHFLF